MLDNTLETEFIPGTNVKGQVAGANWSFLLPSLELERIICFGGLPAAQLVNLAHLAYEVVVICSGEHMAQAVDEIGRRHGLTNLRSMSLGAAIGLPDGSVSLALFSGKGDARPLAHDPAFQNELRRILKPDGLIYLEQRGLRSRSRLRRLAGAFGATQLYWLTPMGGEMHTAVPVQDRLTARYFLRHGLTSRSIDLGALKRAARSVNASPTSQAPTLPSATMHSAADQQHDGLKSRLKRTARTSLAALLRRVQSAFDRAEQRVSRHPTLGRFSRRYGMLVARGAAELSDQPPAYLRKIAAAAGVSIDHHRWGLSARGEYQSRKVLFFLFNHADEAPEYIVKITRDPSLNPRLENEYRALEWLAERGIGDRETVPQPAFYGHHNALAVVGETVIDGVPFERRSSGTADCPHARAAVEWLTELGASTADRMATTPLHVAEGLDTLFERFTQIYQLSSEQRDFLAGQIATIGRSRTAFPLVFQHGDPGTWNIWVSRSERIAFLDWEAAEPRGMPLWDLFYFVRTYGAWSMRAGGAGDIMKGFTGQFLSATAFQRLLVEATRRYCARVGVAGELVEPLFYTCWMHRALKESTRLTAGGLERGHYISLLRASIKRREALASLFSQQLNDSGSVSTD